MSLDKVLHKHIDSMEEIEEMLKEDIELIISSIDKIKLLDSPSQSMAEIADEIAVLMEDKYIPMAAKNGLDLTGVINRLNKKDKEIVIDPSKNPKENADII